MKKYKFYFSELPNQRIMAAKLFGGLAARGGAQQLLRRSGSLTRQSARVLLQVKKKKK
jgi:hypothetical protein